MKLVIDCGDRAIYNALYTAVAKWRGLQCVQWYTELKYIAKDRLIIFDTILYYIVIQPDKEDDFCLKWNGNYLKRRAFSPFSLR